MMNYYVTGNEYLSLPTIREDDGAIEGLTFLYMTAKGMLEMAGHGEKPLLKPTLTIDGNNVPFSQLTWAYTCHWLPTFTFALEGVSVTATLFAPLGQRGFVYRFVVKSEAEKLVEVGLQGCWANTRHQINETKQVAGTSHSFKSGWNHAFVMEMRTGLPLFALAPMGDDDLIYDFVQDNNKIDFTLSKKKKLNGGEEAEFSFIFGLGYEEVAASTSAKEIYRQGVAHCFEQTCQWLKEREKVIENQKLSALLNTNMFFSFFFSSGITLDTEEFCLMTSRSPRYYVSAAYWDRDSLLWSFPAILMADEQYAREILSYVFTKQMRNVGIHSRYIDGTVLEPGFELDELCAPVIALGKYVQQTGDIAFTKKEFVAEGLLRILGILRQKKNHTLGLYETFLQPTDDMHVYPYLTYDNVLVWKTFHLLAEFMGNDALVKAGEDVKESIHKHCIKTKNGKKVFAWSCDDEGNYDIYDEPPGSLMLLPYYGFCSSDDEVYQSTMSLIRDPDYRYSFAGKPIAEIGCEHAPHPWVLSICNSLLSGHKDTALRHLERTKLDNGIACESVDEHTGACATGAAFATCAGFLAYALYQALKGEGA